MMPTDSPTRLPSDELVARCAIYPKFLAENDAFDPRMLFRLINKKSPFQLSVASVADLPGNALHEYGCNAAAIANQRSGATASNYIGNYQLSVSDAEGATNEVYEVWVERAPELGAQAHCHVMVVERAGLDQNAARKAFKVFVIDHLWSNSQGPDRHVCEVDEPLRDELEQIRLPSRP
jgi:hypothetical protein